MLSLWQPCGAKAGPPSHAREDAGAESELSKEEAVQSSGLTFCRAPTHSRGHLPPPHHALSAAQHPGWVPRGRAFQARTRDTCWSLRLSPGLRGENCFHNNSILGPSFSPNNTMEYSRGSTLRADITERMLEFKSISV